mmetsp:Transcript_8250/g.25534  ORF Transcript_8250/g.25534 Transcript_8250/m.25534 type:complete len:145 (+) Transcript_8250:3376-3810(+)
MRSLTAAAAGAVARMTKNTCARRLVVERHHSVQWQEDPASVPWPFVPRPFSRMTNIGARLVAAARQQQPPHSSRLVFGSFFFRRPSCEQHLPWHSSILTAWDVASFVFGASRLRETTGRVSLAPPGTGHHRPEHGTCCNHTWVS